MSDKRIPNNKPSMSSLKSTADKSPKANKKRQAQQKANLQHPEAIEPSEATDSYATEDPHGHAPNPAAYLKSHLASAFQALPLRSQEHVDVYFLAEIFSQTLALNPQMSRQQRAEAFAKAVLKQKRWKRLLQAIGEQRLNQLTLQIAEELEGSEIFAELVDIVSHPHLSSGSK